MAVSTIRAIDMDLIDDLFGMRGGYVLDFNNRQFSEFFASELGVNIDDGRYAIDGSSKANRFRCFLKTVEPQVRVKALLALWEYRETKRRRSGRAEEYPDAENEFRLLMERLGCQRIAGERPAAANAPELEVNFGRAQALKQELLDLSSLPAQERGYGFERFLKGLFDASGLAPRASFHLAGEQIDGSLELSGDTYLLEAKWTSPLVGVADLRSFEGKVADKAVWSRGLFISHSGFSKDGLDAFGRGKRVVCMDGLDLHDLLDRRLPLGDVLKWKVRRMAETGDPFVRVREIH